MLTMERTRVLITGAAGRDIHNFNIYFRNNYQYEVAAFTAAQIPDIEGGLSSGICRWTLPREDSNFLDEDELDACIRD